MLILQNLSLQAAKRSFLNSTKKYIKIIINNHISISKEPAQVKSPTVVEWNEAISLPLFINAEYHFEIYQKHQFGYNPEELNQVVTGKIVLGQNDTFNNWEVVNQKNQKFGLLSANIRKRLKYSPNISNLQTQDQIVSVSSIIAHLNSLKQKRAFVMIKLEDKIYKTQIVKNKSGELLFSEGLEIQKTDQITQATVQVYSYDSKEQKSELVGRGILKMEQDHIQKRVIIKNQKGHQVGEIVVDHRIVAKHIYNSSKQLTKIVQRASLLSKSIDVDRKTQNFNLANSYLAKSMISNEGSPLMHSRRSSDKRVSIVNHNKNIFMPTEKRFTNYQDRQNNKISYLQDRHDFDFKQKHSKQYYKGASIGVGDKFDFTHLLKSNPGVGVYNLPSIWDRY